MFSATRIPSSLLRPCNSSLRPSLFSLPQQTRHASSLRKSQLSKGEQAWSRAGNALKFYKPVTPSLRHHVRVRNDHLWQGKPIKALTIPKRKKGGRNHSGKITVRHIGGGAKQRIRLVDFHRREGGPHDVVRIEYDPGRSAHIALIKNRTPTDPKSPIWSYILAPKGLRAGDVVQSFRAGIPRDFLPDFSAREEVPQQDAVLAPEEAQSRVDVDDILEQYSGRSDLAAEEPSSPEDYSPPPPAPVPSEATPPSSSPSQGEGKYLTEEQQRLAQGLLRTLALKPGNVLPLHLIPVGTICHNFSLLPEGPGVLVRSAGTFGTVLFFEENTPYAHVKLQSGEVRRLHRKCHATVGMVSNEHWKMRSLGKAGRSRNLGIRPTVRGVAMNKCDHPHGGGRGKSKSNKQPVSPWGWHTKGKRTRKPGPFGPKGNNKFVVMERPRGRNTPNRYN